MSMSQNKIENIENYISERVNQINQNHTIINSETVQKGIKLFTSSAYSAYSEKQIFLEIEKEIERILKERERRIRQFEEFKKKKDKFEPLKKLYNEKKDYYNNKDYKIKEIYQTKNNQSVYKTEMAKIEDNKGHEKIGFVKGDKSPNEYELLASRLGKIFNIPVADYSLLFNDESKEIQGISISCIENEDQTMFDGYDLINETLNSEDCPKELKTNLQEMVVVAKKTKEEKDRNPNTPTPPLTKEETKKYMGLLIGCFEYKVKDKDQLEQLKKDYFKSVLFNAIIDQKDYHLSNIGILYNKKDDSYKLSPLFDNGNCKKDEAIEGKINVIFGHSEKSDVIDILFSDYYDYISDFTKNLVSEKEKQYNNEDNMIDSMMTCIDDTIVPEEATEYKDIVSSTIENVVQKEKEKSKTHEETKTEDKKTIELSKML